MLSKDKQICVVIDFENLNTNFITNEYTYNKLQSYFKNLIFINCKFINEKPHLISPEIKKKLKKFKLKWPKSEKEFLNCFKDKKTVVINSVPKSFGYLNVFFLLNKIYVKQIVISNLGQIQGSWSNLKRKLSLSYLFILLNNKFCPIIITLLSNIGIVPKIDIRFYSNKNYLKSINKSNIKNFLYKKNFFYTKKIVPINSKFYDEYSEKKIKLSHKYITHLDADLNYRHKIDKNKKYEKETIDKHYFFLNNFLKNLQKTFKKKVIVSIHPNYNQKFIERKFKNFKVIKYQTRKLIQNSFIVTDFGSSSILDAIILKKNIITLFSPFIKYDNNVYSSSLNLFKYNIINKIDFFKSSLLKNLRIKKNNYNILLNSKHSISKKKGYNIIIKEINNLLKVM